jgi:hypothetical protein
MDLLYTLIFTVFPYLCLTTFVVGHGYRYVTDRYGWNARSSEFLEKRPSSPERSSFTGASCSLSWAMPAACWSPSGSSIFSASTARRI